MGGPHRVVRTIDFFARFPLTPAELDADREPLSQIRMMTTSVVLAEEGDVVDIFLEGSYTMRGWTTGFVQTVSSEGLATVLASRVTTGAVKREELDYEGGDTLRKRVLRESALIRNPRRSNMCKVTAIALCKLHETMKGRLMDPGQLLYVVLGHGGTDYMVPLLAGLCEHAAEERGRVLVLTCNAKHFEFTEPRQDHLLSLQTGHIEYKMIDLLQPERDLTLAIEKAVLEALRKWGLKTAQAVHGESGMDVLMSPSATPCLDYAEDLMVPAIWHQLSKKYHGPGVTFKRTQWVILNNPGLDEFKGATVADLPKGEQLRTSISAVLSSGKDLVERLGGVKDIARAFDADLTNALGGYGEMRKDPCIDLVCKMKPLVSRYSLGTQLDWLRRRGHAEDVLGLFLEITGPTTGATLTNLDKGRRRRLLMSQQTRRRTELDAIKDNREKMPAAGVCAKDEEQWARELVAWALRFYAVGVGLETKVQETTGRRGGKGSPGQQLKSYEDEAAKVAQLLTGATAQWVGALLALLFPDSGGWIEKVQLVVKEGPGHDWAAMIRHNMLPGPGRQVGAVMEQTMCLWEELFQTAGWTSLKLSWSAVQGGSSGDDPVG